MQKKYNVENIDLIIGRKEYGTLYNIYSMAREKATYGDLTFDNFISGIVDWYINDGRTYAHRVAIRKNEDFEEHLPQFEYWTEKYRPTPAEIRELQKNWYY